MTKNIKMNREASASINEILGQIEQRLDTIRVFDKDAKPVALDPLSEVGLYLSNDRLLAELYRQYLEAQRNYVTSLKQHGADSAMTEIALDMSESSFCAMETRLIELRHQEEMKAKVERVQKKQREEYEQEMQKRQAEYARRGIEQPEQIRVNTADIKQVQTAQKAQSKEQNMFWALMAFSFMGNDMLEPSRPAKMDFSQAAA